MTRKKGISILGSTGSIGTSTLDVIRNHTDRFQVISLAAGNNTDLLKEQIAEFAPVFVSVQTTEAAKEISRDAPKGLKIGVGVDGACEAASYSGVEITVSAISGAAGLVPTLAAIKAGKDIALANKETLVLAGPLVMEEAARRSVRLLPVDSEHSAVFQSLSGHRRDDIKRLVLTASGGPFLVDNGVDLDTVTPELALKHPKWNMGRKISIDSATLMNKGLEVIEARWLFDIPPEQISVVIHPQSIVHSMVEYIDGSMISQMSSPDMKGPIAYALAWPGRIDSGTKPLSLPGLQLDFMAPDIKRFPCLSLSWEALSMGGTAPAVLNAADEIAVEMFLSGRIRFTGIYRLISEVLSRHSVVAASSLEAVLEADRWAREVAISLVDGLGLKI
ncbi:MAG: 1-deoxy-D-xylulose-5-phosphate reductoisomerase [Deltaproteobacteria bacterium]